MLKRGLILFLALLLVSCRGDEQDGNLPKTRQFELQKSSFSALEGWQNDDLQSFDKALRGVCGALVKKKQQNLESEKMAYALKPYQEHCKKMERLGDLRALKVYIEQNFEPYAVVWNGSKSGKFTSYYEAELRASYQKGGQYQYPIYGKPNDLIEINLRDFDLALPNQRLVGRVKDGKLIKYYTRAEIDSGKLDAPVILWGDNPVDIYIMQIQGAAVAKLPNGKEIRIGYADNNGHKFRGIGSILLEKGLIKPGQSSMPEVREWLNENGESAKKNMLLNDRFIFHKIVEADGPIGAMGLALTAGRSLAVDKTFIPLGSMMWLQTKAPDGGAIEKLVMAQDIGSAIKGGVRGDYFWGHGEEALAQAGRMNAAGQYFILLPKGVEAKLYD